MAPNRHVLANHNDEWVAQVLIKCGECGQRFCHNRSLVRHLLVVHQNGRVYHCKKCNNRRFLTRHSYVTHMRSHARLERVLPCKQCDYVATSRAAFRRHRMTHDKRKPYKCCVCDYTSLDVGLVTYHIATTHFKQKAHKCDKCDKTFALVGLLKKHKLTHAKDEPCV